MKKLVQMGRKVTVKPLSIISVVVVTNEEGIIQVDDF